METNMVLSLSTTWTEIAAASDLTALTIARLLVEKIISCHGMPAELLSDRGTASQAFKTKASCVWRHGSSQSEHNRLPSIN